MTAGDGNTVWFQSEKKDGNVPSFKNFCSFQPKEFKEFKFIIYLTNFYLFIYNLFIYYLFKELIFFSRLSSIKKGFRRANRMA